MKTGDGDPHDLLAMADGLLRRADPTTAGLWPRASALLALHALEASLLRLWESRSLDLQGCSMRTQLICLRSYLEDAKLAERTGDVLPRLEREAGPLLARALKQCDEGAQEVQTTAAIELVRQSSKLAAWLRGLA